MPKRRFELFPHLLAELIGLEYNGQFAPAQDIHHQLDILVVGNLKLVTVVIKKPALFRRVPTFLGDLFGRDSKESNLREFVGFPIEDSVCRCEVLPQGNRALANGFILPNRGLGNPVHREGTESLLGVAPSVQIPVVAKTHDLEGRNDPLPGGRTELLVDHEQSFAEENSFDHASKDSVLDVPPTDRKDFDLVGPILFGKLAGFDAHLLDPLPEFFRDLGKRSFRDVAKDLLDREQRSELVLAEPDPRQLEPVSRIQIVSIGARSGRADQRGAKRIAQKVDVSFDRSVVDACSLRQILLRDRLTLHKAVQDRVDLGDRLQIRHARGNPFSAFRRDRRPEDDTERSLRASDRPELDFVRGWIELEENVSGPSTGRFGAESLPLDAVLRVTLPHFFAAKDLRRLPDLVDAVDF